MAGRIPKKFIDDLLDRVDVVDIIDSRVPLKKAGKDYKACCPFHEEKTPSFTVSADKQFYHCFGCGEHGTAIGFLMNYDRLSFPEAVRELASQAGLEVPQEAREDAEAARTHTDLLEILNQADRFFRRQLREHPEAGRVADYLKGRGLSGEIAAEFALGFAPPGWDNLLQELGKDEAARELMFTAGLTAKKDSGGYYDRFRDRVIFPIHDYRGRVVGFGGRLIPVGEPDAQGSASTQKAGINAAGDTKSGAAKYLNSPETPVFHKGREVYGLYRARDSIRREQRVLVVEGYMDVVALAQFGIDYACATLGTATTTGHIERLFRFAAEIVFAFDGDKAGRQAAWRALENVLPAIAAGRQASFLFIPEGEDPDSLVRKEGSEAFVQRVVDAKPLGEYLIESLAEKVDLGRMDGRARMVELARPLIEKLPDGVFRQMVVEKLGERSHVKAENLSTLLGSSKTAASNKRVTRPWRSGNAGLQGPPPLMRRAVALILHQPRLAQLIPQPEEIAGLEVRGGALLAEMVQVVLSRPEVTSARLLEYFRDSEHYSHLEKLAVWQDSVGEQGIEAEFTDLMARLHRESLRERLNQLWAKGPDLSESEKQESREIRKKLDQPESD